MTAIILLCARRIFALLHYALMFYILAVPCLKAADTLSVPVLSPTSVTVYDLEEGLPLSCTDRVVEDPKGRLWMNPCRTQDIHQKLGFYMYDGKRYFQIKLNSYDAQRSGTIWYIEGITTSGLLYGQDSEHQLSFVYDTDSGQNWIFSFEEREFVKNILEGENGQLFVLTQNSNAYFIYSLDKEGIEQLVNIPADIQPEEQSIGPYLPAALSGSSIYFLHQNKGFFSYDLVKNKVNQYTWKELLADSFGGRPDFLAEHKTSNFYTDNNGNLLFYFRDGQKFWKYSLSTGSFEPINRINAYLNKYHLNFDSDATFFKDSKGNTLITLKWGSGTIESGLYYEKAAVLLGQDGSLVDYTPVVLKVEDGRFEKNYADCFFSRDFTRNVLMASNGGLIAVEVDNKLPIAHFFTKRPARAMAEVGPNKVVVLSESGFQAVFDIGNDGNSSSMDQPIGIMELRVSSAAQLVEKEDAIWYPAEGRPELIRYDKQTKAYNVFPVGEHFEKFNFCGEQEIALVNDNNELLLYDLEKKQLKPFLKNGKPLYLGGSVNQLVAGKNGVVWIASLDGLWRFDPQAEICENIGIESGLSDENILCVKEMSDGKLWLGTLFGGIQIYDPKVGKVTIVNESDGLSNNTVAGILDDDQGDVWAATFDGLTVLSPTGKVLFELSEDDGLTHREFNRSSFLKTSDGKLLFGGVSGVNVFRPENIKAAFTQNDRLKIYLTEISFFDKKSGKDVRLNEGFEEMGAIDIPASHRYIRLNFGLSNYLTPEKNNFSYQVYRSGAEYPDAGSKENWTSLGYNSELILNDLPVGVYEIRIRATNYQGRSTVYPITVVVNVQEFFFKTWWFYALLAIPFLLGGYFWIQHLRTERVRLESEVEKRTLQVQQDKALIERQAAELLELDEMKSRFFTNISHEFRTPLTIISGMVTQIRQHPDQWLEKGMELIHRNSNQLLSLINQILDLHKLESGALKPHMIHANIVPYLRYLTESIAPMAEAKGIRIHFLSTPSEVVMDYDPDKMLQIMSNLLSNAIKYTPVKGDIYVHMDYGSEGGEDLLRIRVQDTGQGIGPEALPYIFDRFYQVQDLASHKPQGSGIGLALTQELVKLLKGTIEVDSTPGVGTTFTLLFPVSKEAQLQEEYFSPFGFKPISTAPSVVQEQTSITTNDTQDSNLTFAKSEVSLSDDGLPTVLLVEDNADVRFYINAFLKARYRMITAMDGEEGIRMAIEFVPDLIVSDVMMPVKDGFELCDTLKNDKRTSHIPIVLLTAKADFDSKMSGLRKGADVYLTKPFEQEELLVRLEQLLVLRQKLRERYQNAAQTVPSPSTPSYEMEDAFIHKLRQLVLDNISDEDFGIIQLCRNIGVSRTQLHNKIKALTGQSTSEFVRMVRMHKAQELLRTTDLNVSEVGYEVGISNPSYFSRIYSETFGEPPGSIRKS